MFMLCSKAKGVLRRKEPLGRERRQENGPSKGCPSNESAIDNQRSELRGLGGRKDRWGRRKTCKILTLFWEGT